MNNIYLLPDLKLTQNCDYSTKLRIVSIVLSMLVVCIGCIVLLGWYFDVLALKSVFPGRVTMKVSTALCFILSSISLLLWHGQQASEARRISRFSNSKKKYYFHNLLSIFLYFLPSLLVVFTILTLIKYGFQIDGGARFPSVSESIDTVDAAIGGRMSPNTALSFFWFNGAILLLVQKCYLAVQLSAGVILAIALASLIGHIYDLSWFYGMNSGTGMAVHTAICFILLALALLGTRADKSLMKIITVNQAGGTISRWLIPLVTFIPPFLGWFFWANFTNFEIAIETRIALRILLEVTLLNGIILWTASKLNEIDRQRYRLFYDLQEREQQLRLAFDRAVIGKALVSLEGRFLKVNPALCQLIGYQQSELLRMSLPDITYPEDLNGSSELTLKILTNEINSYQIENRYVHRSGRVVWVLLSIAIVENDGGEPKYFVAQIQDITARKQVEAAISQLNQELEVRVRERTSELATANQNLKAEIIERQKIEQALRSSTATNRALLNAIPDCIFRLSNDGHLLGFKAPKNTPIPLAFNDFLGKKLDEVLPAKVAAVMMEGIAAAITSKKVRVCEYRLCRGADIIDYEARLAVTDCQEVMAIVRDITERKRVEKNICQALEREKNLNELKTRFVSMTSHEFRTPLASILSSSELLEHYGHKWNDERKSNHLHRIQTSVKHMTGLLNDVLLLGKAEAGKLESYPTELDLYQFCQEYVEEIQLNTTTHQIIFTYKNRLKDRTSYYDGGRSAIAFSESLTKVKVLPFAPAVAETPKRVCQTDDTVCLDEKLLRHILNNLLSNAIKYSPDSNKVYFEVEREFETAIFRVRDLGIGIPQEEQEHLFDSFHRFSNASSIPGTGLGLPIVKKAVDLHRGTIAMTSQLGEGTTFIVTLPYANKE